VAARCHGDTPDNTGKTSKHGPQRLNDKLRACLRTRLPQAGQIWIFLHRVRRVVEVT